MSTLSSGLSVIFSVQPSCPFCPPGLRPVGLRNVLVRRMASAFMVSFEGGVLLLPEFFPGLSYLASSSRSILFSFLKLRISLCRASVLRLRLQISVCCELIVSRINRISSVMVSSTSDMSVTFSFTGTKVRKISETTELIDNYFRDILLIIRLLKKTAFQESGERRRSYPYTGL